LAVKGLASRLDFVGICTGRAVTLCLVVVDIMTVVIVAVVVVVVIVAVPCVGETAAHVGKATKRAASLPPLSVLPMMAVVIEVLGG